MDVKLAHGRLVKECENESSTKKPSKFVRNKLCSEQTLLEPVAIF